jgi:hypothetical protein
MAMSVENSSILTRKGILLKGILGAVLFTAILLCLPPLWCGREAKAWLDGDVGLETKLARGVERWIESDLSINDYRTGSRTFNGEWLFGTYLMAGMGFGQTALSHPECRARHIRLMARCIDRLLSAEVREYDRAAWGEDPLEALEGPHHHVAYLGYLNALLSYYGLLDPDSPFRNLNDRITAKLVRHMEESPSLLLCTYPGQKYLPDNCAVIASIALHETVGEPARRELINQWIARCPREFCDKETGLLFQTDRPPARGSGTAMGIYFLSFVDEKLSKNLYQALKRELGAEMCGFGALREYRRRLPRAMGDIDSGPVVLGLGFSATGFALAGSRVHGDADFFTKLYRTSYLFGAPADIKGRRSYIMGGPLGDAIIFAMLTARPAVGRKESTGK